MFHFLLKKNAISYAQLVSSYITIILSLHLGACSQEQAPPGLLAPVTPPPGRFAPITLCLTDLGLTKSLLTLSQPGVSESDYVYAKI